jgi:hypothetical protein
MTAVLLEGINVQVVHPRTGALLQEIKNGDGGVRDGR